jgi:hypothetical protein
LPLPLFLFLHQRTLSAHLLHLTWSLSWTQKRSNSSEKYTFLYSKGRRHSQEKFPSVLFSWHESIHWSLRSAAFQHSFLQRKPRKDDFRKKNWSVRWGHAVFLTSINNSLTFLCRRLCSRRVLWERTQQRRFWFRRLRWNCGQLKVTCLQGKECVVYILRSKRTLISRSSLLSSNNKRNKCSAMKF